MLSFIKTKGASRKWVAKMIADSFDKSGTSYHSQSGTTVPLVIEHCQINRIPFRMEWQPGLGYSITRIEALEIPEARPSLDDVADQVGEDEAPRHQD